MSRLAFPAGVPTYATTTRNDILFPFVGVPAWFIQFVKTITVVVALFGITAPFLALGREYNSSSIVFLAISNLVYIVAISLSLIKSLETSGILHPVSIVMGVLFGKLFAKGLPRLAFGMDYHAAMPFADADQLIRLVAYGNLLTAMAYGILFFACGVISPDDTRKLQTKAKSAFANHVRGNVNAACIITCLVSGLAFLTLLYYTGSFGQHLANISRGLSHSEFEHGDISIGPFAVLMKASLIAPMLFAMSRANVHRQPLFWFFVVFALSLNYLAEGRRSFVVYGLILIFLAWIARNRRLPLMAAGAGAIGIILFFGSVAVVREVFWKKSASQGDAFEILYNSDPSELLSKSFEEMRLRSASQSSLYAILQKVPDDVPMQLGATYMNWTTQFVPRAIWPNKPRGIDYQAGQVFFGVPWGMPPGDLGEAYWNFHLLGVIGIFYLQGRILNWLFRRLVRNQHNIGFGLVYLITVFNFDFTQTSFANWLYLMGCCFPVLVFIGAFRSDGN